MTDIVQGFIELGIKQAALCRKNPEAYISTLVTCGSQRLVLSNVYAALVKDSGLPKIEDLTTERKREYWTSAKEASAGRLSKDKLELLAHCLYCLDHLLSNY